jgi:2-polyprenyl-6-methoxyphenol hydroxylase-like FAD-dependent oxidoreductase
LCSGTTSSTSSAPATPETAGEISANSFRWDGQLLAVEGRAPVHVPGHGYGIGRRRLLEILAARALRLGVDVRFEHEVEDLGELADADLIVACDGVASRLRQQRRDHFETTVGVGRNKYIWLGTRKVFDSFPIQRAVVRERATLCRPRARALLRSAQERRSPLLPRVTPPAYYRLHQATRHVTALRRLRRWVAPRIKSHYRH